MKIIAGWRLARFSLLLLGSLLLVAAAQAATYYVSPSGSDASSGTLAAPFATLQRAVNLVNPGDTIYLRGGTYTLAAPVTISRNGGSGNLIKVFNYPSEVPILDGISLTNTNHSGIQLDNASWWHFQGLEIKNVPAHGFNLTGASSNNIIERCVLHHNTRMQLNGAGITVVDTSANNLIVNNDSHHNGVPGSSGGDGIGVNYTQATGNIVRGNRVWRNNDDGIDLWNAANVLVENNWSWENGYNDALVPSAGDGVGFKLGGGGIGDGNHTIRNNLAWRNEHSGFEDNGANLSMNVFNNTGYENGLSNFSFYSPVAYVLKNNLAFPNSLIYLRSPLVQSNNSWNLSLTVSAADFMSLDFSGATGPRNADGSLPTINFLKLAAGSDLIDKGVDVGIAYSGSAPDLGAYEYSAVTPPDTQAPTTPTSLTATTISSSQIDLSWSASTDNVGVVGYNVYRDGVRIATTASTSYSSTGLTAATTYSYSVTAFDAAGNTSAPSTSATARTAPPPDTTPPTVSIASPTGGTVANTILVSVNAADNVGVTRVDLRVNGVTAATTNVAPYQFAWNSTTVPNGPVALTAVAFDAAGNSTTSAAIALSVLNATVTIWVQDAVPSGATVGSDGGDGWNWISSNPTPYSGALAHQSADGAQHQHYFYGATTTLAVGVGDTLFTYVYLDPANPPIEVMLQWSDGSWAHRAYWGANIIGAAGTVTQTYMGGLPPTGQWVRLAVPAAQVGLEGRTLDGMAFTLYGGRATWDYAGKDTTVQPVTLASSVNPAAIGSSVTLTATVTGTNPSGSVNFTDGGSTISGCGAVALTGAGNIRTAACSTGSLSAGSHSIVANYSGDGANAASSSVSLTQVVNANVTIWVEDAVPSGATVGSDGGDGWNWVSSNPPPYSGALAHQSAGGGQHQHYFYGATTTLAVGVGDTLFTYVYLDPANPPSEVMLQWSDGSWAHRAYWGANIIGAAGNVTQTFMGGLPPTGQWVRLAVPAAQLGLEGRTLNGMAFTLYGGRATWDYAGK